MRYLIIGLGSMGKRRIRNLKALGETEIFGCDIRTDRCLEATERYGIKTFELFDLALQEAKPDAIIISTSPKFHMDYAWAAFDIGVPCFIEASVTELERVKLLDERNKASDLLIAPSCTMRYFNGPKKVKELIESSVIGQPLNINYHTGQYLPDWHPWEKVEDFYVSERETGGAREIVSFELTWMNEIFGKPEPIQCIKTKITDLDVAIDDIYHFILKYPAGLLANITIDVVSRPSATRELRILGTEGVLVMSADDNCVRYINVERKEWERFSLGVGQVEEGYINPEEPYISEMRDFRQAVCSADNTLFPNTLSQDAGILEILEHLDLIAEK